MTESVCGWGGQWVETYMLLRPNLENIPPALTAIPHWVVWTQIQEKQTSQSDTVRMRKLPLRCTDGRAVASVADPSTWGTFEAAVSCLKKNRNLAGIAFCLTADLGLVGVDLDHVVVNGRKDSLEAWIRPVVLELRKHTYCEVSPSGTGLHAFALATIGEGRRKGKKIELYNDRRFLTVTGQSIKEPINVISCNVQHLIDKLQRIIEVEAEESRSKYRRQEPVHEQKTARRVSLAMTDRELLEKARNAVNGHHFSALFFYGDIGGYPSHSEADMALASMLAFWTGPDPMRLDQLMRASALLTSAERQKKWDRSAGGGMTYGERTIEKAISMLREVYSPEQEDTSFSPK